MRSNERLVQYFLDGLDDYPFAETVGSEIETSFLTADRQPITVDQSQQIFRLLVDDGWEVVARKGEILAELQSAEGDRVLYELGRQNIELSVAPQKPEELIAYTGKKLKVLCDAARTVGARPLEEPIVRYDGDLLVIPDERDATWLDLDGRETLNLLTKCSAVQFTIDVPPNKVIAVLNNLGSRLDAFLPVYPQEALWRQYVRRSRANYRPDRYGGPLSFESIEDYCAELVKQDVILNGKLVPHEAAGPFDIPLFLRSVWWYFRLRRFGRKLCIEVRPLPRLSVQKLNDQLTRVGRICRGWDPDPYSDTVRCTCDKCYFTYGKIIYEPLPVRPWYTPTTYYASHKLGLF